MWASIISAGTTLVSGNAKMRQVVDDLPKFFSAEGMATLKAIVEQRKKLLDCEAALGKLLEDFQKGVFTLHDDTSSTGMLELLEMELPSAFKTELDTQAFDDAVSFKAAQHMGFLGEANAKYTNALIAFLKKKADEENAKLNADPSYSMAWLPEPDDYAKLPFALSEEGEMNWKGSLNKDSSFAEVQAAAKRTIMQYLPAMAIKEYADSVVQAGSNIFYWVLLNHSCSHSFALFDGFCVSAVNIRPYMFFP